MSRAKTPLSKALAAGADLKNPARYRGRSPATGRRPLGEPYVQMTDAQKAAWEAFRADLPWLNSSHRTIVRLACVTQARIEAADAPGVNLLSAFSSILSKLGATPVDEHRVAKGDPDGEDPLSEKYFN